MTNTATPPQIEIFKPGTYTSVEGVKMTFSAGDMAELVETYNPVTNPAPLVIGHPGMDDPAYGWTRGLTLASGDVLVAETEQVESSFAESVNAGRYKKISAQFYPRDHPSNPTPGKLHLKHIGFFGAHPVAVKGLRSASFSEAQQAGCITIEFPTPQEAPMADDKNKVGELSFAEREAALAKREAAVGQSEADLAAERAATAKQAATARHDANLSFAETQITAGKLLPAGRDELVHVMDTLATPGFASFGEGDKAKSPLAIVQSWFGSAKPVVSFGEFAKDDGAGDAVDPVELGQRASSYAEEQAAKGIIISAAAAVRHVKQEKK